MKLARRIMDEKRALILPLAGAVVVNVFVYAGVVYPLTVRVAQVEARAAVAGVALDTAERQREHATRAVAGKARADDELHRFYSDVLPADLAGARRITSVRLARLADEAGLRYERRSVRETRTTESQLVRLEATMVLQGQYEAVRRFIHALETDPEFVVIDSVSLSQTEEGHQPLMLNLEVSTYYRTAGHGE